MKNTLNSKLRKEADNVGQKVEVVKKKFVAGDSSISSAQLILDAVKEMAVNDKREEELLAAQRRISELENQIRDFTRPTKVQKTSKK